MSTEKIRPSFTFTEDRLSELRAIAPEAFPDGKLDWNLLREALGEFVNEDEAPSEHFGLNWPGKRDVRRLAAKPSHGTLAPALGEGINEDTTGNLYIEGDNLEVIKLLQKSYAGRIKMIFIDPPYNTGKDFVYKDDFKEPLDSFLRISKQSTETGELTTSNPKSSGRFHTNWLNMIYPRLRVARNLLQSDGLIFVTIDDNEYHNLRSVMDETFGAENFLGSIIWQHSIQGKNDVQTISNHHNYIVLYGKSSETEVMRLDRTEEHNVNYSNPDNDLEGPWRSGDVRSPNYRVNLRYDIITPSGKRIAPPENGWRWDKVALQKKISTGEISFRENETKILRKIYLKNQQGRVVESIWLGKESGTTREASTELKDLFDGSSPFDTPKPTKLISRLAQVSGVGENDIVLDFFPGSSTTGHAILKLNREDGIKRQFILVQISEPTPLDSTAYKSGYKSISEIGKERLRRAIIQLQQQQAIISSIPEDIGFKVFKLSPSNLKSWKNYEGDDLKAVRSLFDEYESPLVDGWTPDGLLTEVMLLEGFPLDSKIELQAQFTKNTLRIVSSHASGHQLWTCFDDSISTETLEELTLLEGDVFVCLDAALNDNSKLRLTQAGVLKTI